MSNPDEISLDYLLVADGAHAVGGKLYVLGGGWDQLHVPQLPGQPFVPFSVAVGIMIPWNLTNRKLAFSIDVKDADGGNVAKVAAGEFEVGRPPGLRPGTAQRFQIAVPARPEFGSAGRYVIECAIEDKVLGHVAIEVSATPQAGLAQS
jgi:hypothetical protein